MAQVQIESPSSESTAPFGLTVGACMPTHAFTPAGLLLLASGERIVAESQLTRLLAPDVIFSDDPPPAVRAAIAVRTQALGLARATRAATCPEAAAEAGQATSAAVQSPTSLTEELLQAAEVHSAVVEQAERLVKDVRSGIPAVLAPARGTVVRVVESVRRNHRAFASLLRLKQADDFTFTHSVNTCVLSVMLAEQCGLAPEAENVGLAGLVHDLGKVSIPSEILNKVDPFTDEEWQLVREHPVAGLSLLHRSEELPSSIVQSVSQHHEHMDGTGYPYGLKGESIGPAARIVAIANAYENVTSQHPRRPALPPAEAAQWILTNAGGRFDPDLVRAFVRAVGVYPIGSLLRLNTGELAVVVDFDCNALLRPIVLIVTTSWEAPLTTPVILDLAEASPAAAQRQIVRTEDPAAFGLDIEKCLSLPASPLQAAPVGLDSRA